MLAADKHLHLHPIVDHFTIALLVAGIAVEVIAALIVFSDAASDRPSELIVA